MRTIFKSIFASVLIFSLASCNDRLEGDEILSTEPLKIDSVKIAQDTMDIYTTQTIKTYSLFSTQCEGFYGYDYQHVAPLERKVISYKFKTSASCGEVATRVSQINFRPQQTGTYVFRFWNGKDTAGANIWIEKNIVVQ